MALHPEIEIQVTGFDVLLGNEFDVSANLGRFFGSAVDGWQVARSAEGGQDDDL